jgi:hypothetical protein
LTEEEAEKRAKEEARMTVEAEKEQKAEKANDEK